MRLFSTYADDKMPTNERILNEELVISTADHDLPPRNSALLSLASSLYNSIPDSLDSDLSLEGTTDPDARVAIQETYAPVQNSSLVATKRQELCLCSQKPLNEESRQKSIDAFVHQSENGVHQY